MKRGLLLGLLLVPALGRAEPREQPLRGDPRHGAALYRLDCAGCHGVGGLGDGLLAPQLHPAPPALRSPAFLLARTDADLRRAIRDGGVATARVAAMPAFGKELGELELWDLVVYLRQNSLRLTELFPQAARYLVKDYAPDAQGLARLRQELGPAAPVGPLEVLTIFGGDREPGEPPRLEPQDAVTLDSLKPTDKLGYVVFVPIQLPGEARAGLVALALDREGRIIKLRSAAGQDDAARDKRLTGYTGLGGKRWTGSLRSGKKPAPGTAAGVLEGVDAAYARALAAIARYDQEEHERTWVEPSAP